MSTPCAECASQSLLGPFEQPYRLLGGQPNAVLTGRSVTVKLQLDARKNGRPKTHHTLWQCDCRSALGINQHYFEEVAAMGDIRSDLQNLSDRLVLRSTLVRLHAESFCWKGLRAKAGGPVRGELVMHCLPPEEEEEEEELLYALRPIHLLSSRWRQVGEVRAEVEEMQ